MGILIDFKTGEQIIEKPLTTEEQFMKDLMFIMSSATTEEAVKECIFSKYLITIKKTKNNEN